MAAVPAPRDSPLRNYLTVQRRYDAQLDKLLDDTARAIRARIRRLPAGVGGQVRASQLRLVLAEIKNLQHEMWLTGVRDNIVSGRKAAIQAAQDAAETLTAATYALVPERVAKALTDGLRAEAVSGLESEAARVPRELSTRVYHDYALTSGAVDKTIRQGLIQNLSARELAADVYRFISPATPGGASYAAKRLARTEINNAFHERQIAAAKRPGVLGAVWNLSGSHPRPDECNQFAEGNKYDLGRGVYPVDNVPGKPHPNCFCFLTYKTMTPRQFADALDNGDFDDELDRRTRANVQRLLSA